MSGSTASEKKISRDQIVKEFQFVIDFMPQMVWATQPDGYHDFYNKRWYEFTGLSYEDTKDKGWSLVLHPDDYEKTWKVWKNSLETGKIYEIEYRMRKFDGTYNWFLARAQPLRDANGEILKWFGTCTDIQEQREILEELSLARKEVRFANYELKEKNRELVRINRELDNFVYTASHDLKAPLNNLEGLVELLDPSDEDYDGQNEIRHMIGSEVRRFKGVVNEMSLIAREAKETNIYPKVNLVKLIEEIKYDLKNLINSTNTSIVLDLEIKELFYSRKDIRSVLMNLISNGIKYRHKLRAPVITIRSKVLQGNISLQVEDNGHGIKEKDIPIIFEKYQRINKTVEGSGLGLYIVKRIVENKGGSIKVESIENQGSKFSVFLKLKQNH